MHVHGTAFTALALDEEKESGRADGARVAFEILKRCSINVSSCVGLASSQAADQQRPASGYQVSDDHHWHKQGRAI